MPAHDEESHQLLARSSFDIEDPDPDQSAPFLKHRSSRATSPVEPISSLSPVKPKRTIPLRSLLLHAGLIALYTVLAITYTALARQADRIHNHFDNIPRHPALPSLLTSIPYTVQPFGFVPTSTSFTGQPSKSTIDAWDELLAARYLNVSNMELVDAANFDMPSVIPRPMRSSVKLPGGGELASLGAWTELACVQRLWEANYRDVGMGAEEQRASQERADQCVERLRQAAMCRADTETLSTYAWTKDGEGEKESSGWDFEQDLQRSRCVNWEKVVGILKGRVVADSDMEELRRGHEQGAK